MGTDMTGPEGFKQGNNIAVSVNCDSEEEIGSFYSKLSEGGSVMESLKLQFWGALFGVIVDKFGICWMLNFDERKVPLVFRENRRARRIIMRLDYGAASVVTTHVGISLAVCTTWLPSGMRSLLSTITRIGFRPGTSLTVKRGLSVITVLMPTITAS